MIYRWFAHSKGCLNCLLIIMFCAMAGINMLRIPGFFLNVKSGLSKKEYWKILNKMGKHNLRESFRLIYLTIILYFVLFIPNKLRQLFVIFLSFFSNPIFKTVGLVYFFVSGIVNFLFIFVAYYCGIGLSAVISFFIRADYLYLRKNDRTTFWFKKDKVDKNIDYLKRQF